MLDAVCLLLQADVSRAQVVPLQPGVSGSSSTAAAAAPRDSSRHVPLVSWGPCRSACVTSAFMSFPLLLIAVSVHLMGRHTAGSSHHTDSCAHVWMQCAV
jgi:hypothetical protein